MACPRRGLGQNDIQRGRGMVGWNYVRFNNIGDEWGRGKEMVQSGVNLMGYGIKGEFLSGGMFNPPRIKQVMGSNTFAEKICLRGDLSWGGYPGEESAYL